VHPNPLEWPPWQASVPQNQEVFQPLGSLKTAVGDKAVKTQRNSQATSYPVEKIAKPTAAQLKLLGSGQRALRYGAHLERGC